MRRASLRRLFPFSAFLALHAAPLLAAGPNGDSRPPIVLPPEAARDAAANPLLVRWMLHPIPEGMFISLPVIDSNPNRGVTYGVMPIWVLKERGGSRIRQIHAPSLTYNEVFRLVSTYRLYFYPDPRSNLILRGSLGQTVDKELMGRYETLDFLGRDLSLSAKLQYNVDGARRFFGLGPVSSPDDESNYTQRTIQYYVHLGLPILRKSGWKFNVAHRLAGEKLSAGPMEKLPDLERLFPSHAPKRTHQDAELQFYMDYDTRDNPVTGSRGSYAKLFLENSQRAVGSEFAFQKYGFDLRHLEPGAGGRFISAGSLVYQQLAGDAPFYLMPQLGGKRVHRAYGEGRYIARGVAALNLEERITLYELPMAGVTTRFELAPFFGLGAAFDTPNKTARRHVRPVFGAALRAVARPQVVGSIDIAAGQEGLTIFMDIDYPF